MFKKKSARFVEDLANVVNGHLLRDFIGDLIKTLRGVTAYQEWTEIHIGRRHTGFLIGSGKSPHRGVTNWEGGIDVCFAREWGRLGLENAIPKPRILNA